MNGPGTSDQSGSCADPGEGSTVPREAVEVIPSGPVSGTLSAPASKSVTNRLLVLAALAEGTSRLHDPLRSDDSAAMCDVVSALGADVAETTRGWIIRGTGGLMRVRSAAVSARLSGTTMRFGAALAALAPAPITLTGDPPLRRRPLAPLTSALQELGGAVKDEGGYPPFHSSGGGLAGGEVTVDARGSSQFVSAILLPAPYARRDVVVAPSGGGASAYVDLTVDAMRRWGGEVHDASGGRWVVRAGQGYAARDEQVEYDASAAAHLMAVAAATGGSVTISNAEPTIQPDAAFGEVLTRMGAIVTREDGRVSLVGPEVLAPVDVDLSAMPDQVTSLAALCALAHGTSVIRGVGVARGHETDRLTALATELGKVGVRVDEGPGELRIHGGGPRGSARLATYDDHRLAMAFAALAARVPGVVVEEPGCVTKTYPSFWTDLRRLGVRWREVRS